MKKNDPRRNDTRITQGSDNIFLDLGFDPAEARILLMRADLMINIRNYLDAKGWTQAEAAKRLGITQPRVSKLKKGVAEEFSIDMLLIFAARLGLEPELRLAA
jgi:predicted XRE-type DNA-binding protein